MEIFDRQQDAVGQGEKTLLVYVDLPNNRNLQNSESEFEILAKSSGLEIKKLIQIQRKTIDPQYFIGSGKIEEIADIIEDLDIELVIFSSDLSPSQERNLERKIKCRIIDRTRLILDIFALRARSFEGKLQVELAQLKHLSTRLVRGWTHLERQKGGIGLRGPGETQLETDRRLLGQRIKYLNNRLSKVSKQRDLSRKSRTKKQLPMVALAGYTNAGKSTLFNVMTGSDVYANDQLFATLDATIRRVIVPGFGEAVFADTVGFIQDLPHDLVEAFKSTLQETIESNVLLHVVDCADENYLEKIYQVDEILSEIGAKDMKTILVMNKIDLIEDLKPHIDRDHDGEITKVWLSSEKNLGMNLLYQALSECLSGMMTQAKIQLDVASAYVRSEIHNIGYIHSEKMDEFGQWILEINVTKHYLNKILNKQGVKLLWQQKTPQMILN
ncbi:MAG: GTPase HflX [Gammaproteobacteria bacterium]|nr:GTPase HflX [Gammaproteobacteria bacterium]